MAVHQQPWVSGWEEWGELFCSTLYLSSVFAYQPDLYAKIDIDKVKYT